jgi:hypothetical protein
VLRENELQACGAKALDEVDDLPARVAEDVTDPGAVQAFPDEPCDARHLA